MSGVPSTIPTISIVGPCFNEAGVVLPFYQELRRVIDTIDDFRFEIIFVDDGSSDTTLDELMAIARDDERVHVRSFSRNFGHQIALSAGMDHADGDAVILMDTDLQHPPRIIPEMLSLWSAGNDVVLTVRQQTEGAGLLKRATSGAFYWVFNHLSDVQIRPGAADFCLLSKCAYKTLCSMPERHRFLRGMTSWMGFRRSEIPYQADRRVAGVSKYTMRRMVSLAIDSVFSFSAQPMRSATRVGLATTLAGFSYLAYVIFEALWIGGLVPGWATVICLVLIIGGVQLCFLGILGEYIAKIFEEAKGRPLYVLRPLPRGTDRVRAERWRRDDAEWLSESDEVERVLPNARKLASHQPD